MNWHSARTTYKWNKPRKKMYLYEERIVCICAKSDSEAIRKAESEGDSYAQRNSVKRMDGVSVYIQDGDKLIDGYEVWSILLDTDQKFEAFYESRYSSYEANSYST